MVGEKMKNLFVIGFIIILVIISNNKSLSQNNIKNNPVLLNNLSSLYYSTYFGGKSNDTFSAMCLDSSGNIFTAGNTSSSDYPIVNSSSKYHGETDVTINKFDNNGKLLFSMCIGGRNDEYVQEILCDRNNNIWISGETDSDDFPVTGNAFQSNNRGGTKDGYLMKFDNSGNLLFSTFWGGSNYESFAGMTLDKFDNIWVTGRTWSTNFPTTPNAQKSQLSSFYETFLFKVDKNLILVYCSLFGPSISESGTLTLSEAIVSDSDGNIYLSGYSNSAKLPVTVNAYQRNKKGNYDGFLAKFDNNAGLLFCTYFGGSLQDYPSNIAVDANDNIYIQTITASQDLEVKSDNFNQVFFGSLDIYLTKFSNTGNLIWSTYIGGAGKEGEDYNALGKIYGSLSIKNDELYNLFRTTSSGLYSFPESYNENSAGYIDAYLSKFDLNCNLLYSTYFGGIYDEIAGDFVLDNDGKLVICGWTNNIFDLPLKNEIQSQNNGSIDAFLAMFKFGVSKPVILSNNPICEGDDLLLLCDSVPDAEYFWSGPNGFSSNLRKTIIKNAQISHSGRYSLCLKMNGQYSDTSFIDVVVSNFLVSPSDSSLIYLGSSERTDDYLKLTNAKIFDTGAIWLRKKFSFKKDFVTTFEFRVTGGSNGIVKESSIPGADGFAFVIQNHDYPYLGQKGGDMGYTGIPNSLAVEYDMFQNPYDLNGNHIAVQSMGSEPNIANHLITKSMLGRNDNIPIIQQNTIYYSKIEYSWESKTLSIYLGTDSVLQSPVLSVNNFDMTTFLNLEDNEYAYIGFTSGTGNAYQEHQIINWVVPCTNPPVIIDNVGDNFVNSKQMLVYPNPGSDLIEIELDLPLYEKVSLSLTDLTGRVLITILDNQHLLYGKLKLPVNTGDLGSGMYFLRLQTISNIKIQKVLIIK